MTNLFVLIPRILYILVIGPNYIPTFSNIIILLSSILIQLLDFISDFKSNNIDKVMYCLTINYTQYFNTNRWVKILSIKY